MLEDGDVEMIAICSHNPILFILLLIAGDRMIDKGIAHVADAVTIEPSYQPICLRVESVCLNVFHNHIEHSLLDYHPHHLFLLGIGDVHQGV